MAKVFKYIIVFSSLALVLVAFSLLGLAAFTSLSEKLDANTKALSEALAAVKEISSHRDCDCDLLADRLSEIEKQLSLTGKKYEEPTEDN